MEIEQLLDETVEPQLAGWLRKWPDALAALNNIADLFAGLGENRILGQVSEQVSITGPVHIGKGSKIYPFVTIQGPVIIGENVSVRSHSIIRKSSVHRLGLCRGPFGGCKAINLFSTEPRCSVASFLAIAFWVAALGSDQE